MILCKRSNSKDCERKQDHNAAATKKASKTLTRADSGIIGGLAAIKAAVRPKSKDAA